MSKKSIMKRFIISLMATLSATIFVGCSDLWMDNYDPTYDTVYPGIVIYEYASAANNFAVDGVSVAMRLAVLLEELDAAGMEMAEGGTDTLVSSEDGSSKSWSDLDRFEYWEAQVDKRAFLFGDSRDISISRGEGEAAGVYTIFYDKDDTSGHVSASLDINDRSGAYVIDTKGKLLSQTSLISDGWEVSSSEENPVQLGYAGEQEIGAEFVYYESKIWYSGSGTFKFSLITTLNTRTDGAEDVDWGVYDESCSITFEDYVNLLIENLSECDMSITMATAGTTLSGYEMKFVTVDPVVYNYYASPYNSISAKIEATAEATTLSEAKTVTMEREFVDDYLFNDTYTYDGLSYTDSYYYWIY